MITKKEIIQRIDPKTTSSTWKRVRNIAGIISLVGLGITSAPITLPAAAITWITWLTVFSGVVAGRAHLDKSKK